MSRGTPGGSNRSGGGTADGKGGFAAVGGANLADGYSVAEVFEELNGALNGHGYRKHWVDGYLRESDGAVVTAGYSYREIRVRRYLPGHKEKEPQAILNIRRFEDLDQIEDFIGEAAELWEKQPFSLSQVA